MSAFPSEEAFEQWFVDRYGHHTRDWHDDRGLAYPGDAQPLSAKRAATREKIARLAAESPFEGERASARGRLAAFDNPSTAAHAATERGSYYARDTLTGSSDERSENG